MTKVISKPEDYRLWRKMQKGTLGFVPTMGALHSGHEELLKQARNENELVVLSIFVNPTQFNDPTDFEKYPQTWDADLAMAQKNNVDVIFYPQYEQIYPDQFRYKISENEYSKILDGAHRPGHFDGVLTVVMKLFQIIEPQKAYFGEKDFQQLRLIQGMVKSFFMPIEIIPVPTVRETDGLAKSSRNMRLSPEDRAKAPLIFKTIKESPSAEEAKQKLSAFGFEVDYVTDVDNRRFVAAKIGNVRLIDNVQI